MAGATGQERLTIDDIKPDVREVTPVEWPGLPGRMVGILHLNVGELLDAHVEARREFKRRGVPADAWSSEELDREEITQQCYRMLVDPDAGVADARVHKDIVEARARLTAEERAYFIDQYMQLHALGGEAE